MYYLYGWHRRHSLPWGCCLLLCLPVSLLVVFPACSKASTGFRLIGIMLAICLTRTLQTLVILGESRSPLGKSYRPKTKLLSQSLPEKLNSKRKALPKAFGCVCFTISSSSQVGAVVPLTLRCCQPVTLVGWSSQTHWFVYFREQSGFYQTALTRRETHSVCPMS